MRLVPAALRHGFLFLTGFLCNYVCRFLYLGASIMPHYKDADNNIHFIDSDDFAHFLPVGCVKITDAEAEALRPVPAPVVPQVVSASRPAPRCCSPGLDDVEALMAAPDTPALASSHGRMRWNSNGKARPLRHLPAQSG